MRYVAMALLCLMVIWYLRQRRLTGSRSRQLQLVESLVLGRDGTIHLVQVGAEHRLLGTGPKGVVDLGATTLLTPEPTDAAAGPAAPAQSDFLLTLANMLTGGQTSGRKTGGNA